MRLIRCDRVLVAYRRSGLPVPVSDSSRHIFTRQPTPDRYADAMPTISPGASAPDVRVLAFDTFGTVTDWHTGVGTVLSELFPELDGFALTRDWRRTYAPTLAEVESGQRPWTLLDDLHRETLDGLLRSKHDIVADAATLDTAVHAWHTIPGWPDSAPGLARLREKYIVCALSNGHVALLTEMSKHNGFGWDFVGGSDLWRHYKPSPATYLGLVELMRTTPDRAMMVAAHPTDLEAARSHGLRTAFVARPEEWGPEPTNSHPSPADDLHAVDLTDLADRLGC